MIWAAFLLGATVPLAIWAARALSHDFARIDRRAWLVLPDEPQPRALARPQAICDRSRLPVLAVAYPMWSAPDQAWRREKPLRPWFQSPAPYAVAVGMGAVSLDLTALGLGVPEIGSTDLSLHEGIGGQDLSGPIWLQPDPIAPSWDPHPVGPHWWA